MFELIFTTQANETFDLMQEQIGAMWGENSVKEFDERVYYMLELISKSPFIYEALPKYPNIRKAPIHRNSSMFYKINETEVIILFFWDNWQDPML
ncbi:MAG: hypothetical protein ABIX36_00690 [Mucilaginibacter sp.]|uniref:hypothetical protein n=1 Tax=Mucilaginibacter sp. TaxID=1882438 RepID=UPI0032653F86